MTGVIAWFVGFGDGVYIGGDDPNDPNHITFTEQ